MPWTGFLPTQWMAQQMRLKAFWPKQWTEHWSTALAAEAQHAAVGPSTQHDSVIHEQAATLSVRSRCPGMNWPPSNNAKQWHNRRQLCIAHIAAPTEKPLWPLSGS